MPWRVKVAALAVIAASLCANLSGWIELSTDGVNMWVEVETR
jgi:hypothetical protein